MNGARFVDFKRGFAHFYEVLAVARLVSERPEDDRGVVFVGVYHVTHTVNDVPFPAFVRARDSGRKTVRFKVTFAHYDDAVFVAKFVKVATVGIVARADCRNVVFAAKDDVVFIELARDVSAVFGIEFVTVYAADFQRFAVKHNERAAVCFGIIARDFHRSETEHKFSSVRHHGIFAVFVKDIIHFVKIRIFHFPKRYVADFFQKVDLVTSAVFDFGNDDNVLKHFLPVGVAKHHDKPAAAEIGAFRTHRDFRAKEHNTVFIGEFRIVKDIGNEFLRTIYKENVAENTAHSPHVLIFKVTARRELINRHRKAVYAVFYEVGNVVFLIVERVFAVPDEVAVDVNFARAFDTAEIDKNVIVVAFLALEIKDI